MPRHEQFINTGIPKSEKEKQTLRTLFQAQIKARFDDFDNSPERVNDILKKLNNIIDKQDNKVEIISQLEALREVTDREIFCQQAYEILEPLLKWREENLAEFENIRRKDFNEESNFTEINKMLSYNIDGDYIHVHIPPNVSTPNSEKLRLIQEGLKALVPIVEANLEIKTITGTSWIVAAHPQILEKKFHFTITFPENPDQNLDNANRPIAEAEISREDLIKYYS
jgi:hypothetical protein